MALDKSFLEQDVERFERRGVRSKWEKDQLFRLQCKVRQAKADLELARRERERRAA